VHILIAHAQLTAAIGNGKAIVDQFPVVLVARVVLDGLLVRLGEKKDGVDDAVPHSLGDSRFTNVEFASAHAGLGNIGHRFQKVG